MKEEELKEKYAGVIAVLKGLTLSEAQNILRIVNEDITSMLLLGMGVSFRLFQFVIFF